MKKLLLIAFVLLAPATVQAQNIVYEWYSMPLGGGMEWKWVFVDGKSRNFLYWNLVPQQESTVEPLAFPEYHSKYEFIEQELILSPRHRAIECPAVQADTPLPLEELVTINQLLLQVRSLTEERDALLGELGTARRELLVARVKLGLATNYKKKSD